MKLLTRVVLLSLLIWGIAEAQLPFDGPSSSSVPSELVTATTYLSLEPVQIGSSFDVALVTQIGEGWHINSHQPTLDTLIPTEVVVTPPPGLTVGPVLYPEGESIQLEFAGEEMLSVYEGTTVFAFSVKVAQDLGLGEHVLPVEIRYQGCSDTQCLLPTSLKADIQLDVVGLDQSIRRTYEAVFANLNLESPTSGSGPEQNQIGRWIEQRGYFLTFLILFVLGLGLNLTPCVFPMIPITVSFFGGQSDGNSRRTLMLALFYVLGISITISILGVLAAVSGGIWGSALQNPIVLIVVAAVLILLALSMFGVYEIRLPSFLINQSGGSRVGVVGSLFMGLTMGVVAAPCIGPVILGLLLFVSQTANPVLGFWMFFVLAWGLGLPYLFLAVFSGGIHRLPQSGMWMLTVKKIFGFALIGMAIYFVQSLFPDAIQGYPLPGYTILAGLYIGWMDRERISNSFRRIKYVIAVLAVGIGVWMLLPSGESGWPMYEEAAFAQALEAGQPVLLDFFADWCFACTELEERTFSDETVKTALQGFSTFRVDFTRSSDFTKALKAKYEIRGLPTVLFINSKQQEQRALRVEQFISAEEFLQRLQQVE